MLHLAQLHIATTPSLVLVRETLERNLDLMQGMCNAAGVRLRPHGKMHKCSTLAKLQVSKEAVGICAQTIGEAEAFAGAGVRDILITSPPRQGSFLTYAWISTSVSTERVSNPATWNDWQD